MAQTNIVVIEDEEDIVDVVTYNLEREGFQVASFRNGEDGLSAVKSRNPDLILLDLMLPGMDGLEICRSIRSDPRTSSIAIIMVTAKGEESDLVLGLGVGADDYLVKPFSPRELVARIKAVLRRNRAASSGSAPECITVDDLEIDVGRHEVTMNGERISFTATEFRLLYFLASHPGRVFSRDQIIANVIGDGAIVVDRNIDVHVRAVRKKIGEENQFIETVRGVGYRFRDS